MEIETRRTARQPPPARRTDGAARRGPRSEGAHDRGGLQAARARVPGHLDLEDSLPRGPEAAHAAAHARRLSPLRADGRGPAAHDPAPPARRVPAIARDQAGAGRRAQRRGGARPSAGSGGGSRKLRRTTAHRPRRAAPCTASTDVLDETGAEPSLVKELEEYGVIKGERRDGRSSTTTPSARSCGGDRAGAFRRGRAQPARLPHLGRPRGGAARADPGARASLPEPASAGARAWRRSRTSPRSPRISSTCCSSGTCASSSPEGARGRGRPPRAHPRHPGLPEARDRLQGHHAAAARPGGARGRYRHARRGRARSARWTSSWPLRRAASSWARRSPPRSASASCRRESRASCRTRRRRSNTSSSTGSTRSRCTRDAFAGGARVLVHDDLLATGGTARGQVPARGGRRAATWRAARS